MRTKFWQVYGILALMGCQSWLAKIIMLQRGWRKKKIYIANCVVHRTNFATTNAIKICKEFSRKKYLLLKLISVHLKMSYKRGEILHCFDYLKNVLFPKNQKMRLLSRWQAITIFHNFLKKIITYCQDNFEVIKSEIGCSYTFMCFIFCLIVYIFYPCF